MVGIDSIDEHHRYLFRLTSSLQEAIVQQRGSKKIAKVLKALKQYSIIHFREEERMMRHYGSPHLAVQTSQHKYFIKQLENFWEIFRNHPLSLGFEMIYYLRDWLVEHIQKEDKKLAALTR